MKFHLSADGDPRICNATQGKCPYSDAEHFTSAEAARVYFESKNSPFTRKTEIKHKMSLSDSASKLLDDLYEAGFDPYIVGGSVRDSILSGEVPKDIDIEVFGVNDIDTLGNTLSKMGYRMDEVGKSFGVLKTRLKDGDDIDISMPRRDSKVNEGHTGFEIQVDPTLTIEEAAGRRDFTINALYYSKKNGHIIDPFGGIEDFRNERLRHINDHFGEDPLRVVRGVQFAARFKMNLDSSTVQLSQELLKEFESISSERFQTEFEKMFSKGDVKWGLKALEDTGWGEKFHIDKAAQNYSTTIQGAIDRAKALNEDPVVFGAGQLLRTVNFAHQKDTVGYLIAGEKRQEKALKLLKISDPRELSAKSLNAWSRQLWRKEKLTPKDYYIFKGNQAMRAAAEEMGIFEKPQADFITGDMILKLADKKPGPWVGNVLQRANAAQDNGIFTDRKGAEKWLSKWGEKLVAEAPNTPQPVISK